MELYGVVDYRYSSCTGELIEPRRLGVFKTKEAALSVFDPEKGHKLVYLTSREEEDFFMGHFRPVVLEVSDVRKSR